MDLRTRVRAITMTASEAISAGRADYFEALQATIAVAVPADLVMWNSIELETGRVEIQGRDRDQWEWLVPTVARVSPHNPMLAWFLSGQLLPAAARMSDLVERRSFRRGPVYNELFRAMGARFQAGIPTVINHGRGGGRGWAMNRGHRDFSDDEMALLVALQPSLVLLEDLVQRSTGTETETDPDPVWDSLTSRERQVVDLLTEGWTAAHIARRLRISERTVRKHLEHVYAKLGTHDRLLTARLAARNVTPASS